MTFFIEMKLTENDQPIKEWFECEGAVQLTGMDQITCKCRRIGKKTIQKKDLPEKYKPDPEALHYPYKIKEV